MNEGGEKVIEEEEDEFEDTDPENEDLEE